MSKANEALDKMAENARELGLDYEPVKQEPVAWMTKDGEIYKHECWPEHEARPLVFGDASPPAQRKPLTDEQWQVIADTLHCCISRGQKDTIEAALGFKEQNA
jgi:hypothetical protein